LHATIQIATEAVVTGAVTSATALLIPRDGNSYSGVGSLTWPVGGPMDLNIAAAGRVAAARVTMEMPPGQATPVLTIESPASPSALVAGSVVGIDVHATFPFEHGEPKVASGVTIAFQATSSASSQVLVVPGSTLIVPSSVVTDKEGHAKATLVMPDLGVNDGILYIEAVGSGAVSSPLQLTNQKQNH
jgi:hypothetical protein